MINRANAAMTCLLYSFDVSFNDLSTFLNTPPVKGIGSTHFCLEEARIEYSCTANRISIVNNIAKNIESDLGRILCGKEVIRLVIL